MEISSIVLLFYGEAIKKRALVMLWTRIVGQGCKITDSTSEHFNITDQYRNISNKVQVEHVGTLSHDVTDSGVPWPK